MISSPSSGFSLDVLCACELLSSPDGVSDCGARESVVDDTVRVVCCFSAAVFAALPLLAAGSHCKVWRKIFLTLCFGLHAVPSSCEVY
jgi:hypothetical protein